MADGGRTAITSSNALNSFADIDADISLLSLKSMKVTYKCVAKCARFSNSTQIRVRVWFGCKLELSIEGRKCFRLFPEKTMIYAKTL